MKHQNLQPPHYYAYLLRIWREGVPYHWRALLEDPSSGERLGFDSVQALIDFLVAQTQEVDGNQDQVYSSKD